MPQRTQGRTSPSGPLGTLTVDGLPGQLHPLDQDVLILSSGAEEDVVDALIDQLRSGLQRRRRVRRRQRDRAGRSLARAPGIGQHILRASQDG